MKRILTIFCFMLLLSLAVCAQTGKKGVVFKIPEDVFPMDWNKSGFKGILMLRKDSASGLFVGYPNENEKIEDFRERAAKFLVPMFIHDKDKVGEMKWQKSPIPIHRGDVEGSGFYYSYSNEKSVVQVLFYERESSGSRLLYGYFSSKGINDKPSNIWADDKGQGVKIFEKFWKTFSE